MNFRTAKQELRKAMRERSVALNRDSYDLLPVTPDGGLAIALLDMLEIINQVSRSSANWFRHKMSDGMPIFDATAQGQRLVSLVPPSLTLIHSQSPERRFDPRIEMLLMALESRSAHHVPEPLLMAIGRYPHAWVDILNAVVHELRQSTNTQIFFNSQRHHQDAIDKRFRELKHYFRQVDAAYPCASVLRLDLGYRDTLFSTGDYSRSEVRYELLRTQTLAWLTRIKQSLGPAVVGEAWKHDFGELGTYKTHMVIILSGPKASELLGIISMSTDEWHTITGNHGYCFNCNCDQAQFEYRGFTSIDLLTSTVAGQLHRAAVYLAKTDLAIRLEFAGKPSAFGFGRLVRPTRIKAKSSARSKFPIFAYSTKEVTNI